MLGIIFLEKILKMFYHISVSSQVFLHENVATAVLGQMHGLSNPGILCLTVANSKCLGRNEYKSKTHSVAPWVYAFSHQKPTVQGHPNPEVLSLCLVAFDRFSSMNLSNRFLNPCQLLAFQYLQSSKAKAKPDVEVILIKGSSSKQRQQRQPCIQNKSFELNSL